MSAKPRLPAGYRLLCYPTLGSSNDEAKRLARAGAAEGTLVWALQQTSGRGRRGRSWLSPPGNLYTSLVLRPAAPAGEAAQLGFAAALAVGEALGALCPRLAGLAYKWPNDVLIGGRKIAGLLLESEMGAGQAPAFLILGVGVNLISEPSDTEFPATSVAAECEAAPSPRALLEAFAGRFQSWLQRWRLEGFAPIRAAWLEHAFSLGDTIRVHLEGASLHGRFADIDQRGTLLLETGEGMRHIAAAEVFPAS